MAKKKKKGYKLKHAVAIGSGVLGATAVGVIGHKMYIKGKRKRYYNLMGISDPEEHKREIIRQAAKDIKKGRRRGDESFFRPLSPDDWKRQQLRRRVNIYA